MIPIGLKENAIIGKLIPAGTGMPKYRAIDIQNPEAALEAENPPAVEETVG